MDVAECNCMEATLKKWLLSAVLTIGWLVIQGCQTAATGVNMVALQDSVVTQVERGIEAKRRQLRELERFQERQLPRNFSEKMEKYHPIIRKYSNRYGIDWRLTIAQILKESRFKENARSHVGARGLMQIMPHTAREISREIDIAYITRDPYENITAGIYYLHKMLQRFPNADPENRLKLALAAYNAGVARVYDARDIARTLKMDPETWDAVRTCLPLLTDDNWKLHLEVWELGRPKFGYFYGSDETIDYVDDIMAKYDAIRQIFPTADEDPLLANLNAGM